MNRRTLLKTLFGASIAYPVGRELSGEIVPSRASEEACALAAVLSHLERLLVEISMATSDDGVPYFTPRHIAEIQSVMLRTGYNFLQVF